MVDDAKETLRTYFLTLRRAFVGKLDGLSDYDARRPLTPTGTNLLGLVKHMTSNDAVYFGDTFDRPFPGAAVYDFDADPMADMVATADESREELLADYARVGAHAEATIDALTLDSPGRVPHWPAERADVTLHQVLVHSLVEVARHAGHADIVRESIDASVGWSPANPNLPEDGFDWPAHYARVASVADRFR